MVRNINLLESRRRILLNTPHIETISDTIASFETDVATKIKGCKVYFTPIQEGEGDPSPDNVRPIHGWDGITLYLSGSDTSNPTTLTIPFNRTIYGGYVDLVRGEVVEEWTKVVLDGVNKRFNRGNCTRNGAIGCAWVYPYPRAKAQTPDYLVENLPIISYYYENGDPTPSVYMPNGNNRYVILYFSQAENPDVTTPQQIVDFTNNYLSQNPVTIAYPIATPNTYTLTPETIKALKGVNNIWSNTNGNIEVSFYTH